MTSTEDLLLEWKSEQDRLKKKVIYEDTEEWQEEFAKAFSECDQDAELASSFLELNVADFANSSAQKLKFIGGLDISYDKEKPDCGFAALIVLSYPDLKLVYEEITEVETHVPYVPGYLAFREVLSYLKLFKKMQDEKSPYLPQVLMVDGNGLLHPNEFGVACHIGVLLDIPSIGVAKNLHEIDGITRKGHFQEEILELKNPGDYITLKGETGKIYGAAVKTNEKAKKPVFVSQGHRCSLKFAIDLVKNCSKFRIPEPVRQADMISKEYMRKMKTEK